MLSYGKIAFAVAIGTYFASTLFLGRSGFSAVVPHLIQFSELSKHTLWFEVVHEYLSITTFPTFPD